MSSDIEGRFPFAITKARLGRVLRGWATANAETDLPVGSTVVSTSHILGARRRNASRPDLPGLAAAA
jgi:hypothetical protein